MKKIDFKEYVKKKMGEKINEENILFFEHCDNIIMVDVAELTVSDRVCFYNAILKKNEFMHDIKFGSFVKVLKYLTGKSYIYPLQPGMKEFLDQELTL